jgi:hypothetical protein
MISNKLACTSHTKNPTNSTEYWYFFELENILEGSAYICRKIVVASKDFFAHGALQPIDDEQIALTRMFFEKFLNYKCDKRTRLIAA